MSAIDLNTILLIALDIFVFVLFVILILLLIKLYKIDVQNKLNSNSRNGIVNDRAYKEAYMELEEARHRSLEIIKESNYKANEIIREAEFLTDDSRLFLKNQLEDISREQSEKIDALSQQMLDTHLRILRDAVAKNSDTVEQMTKDFESEISKEVDEFAGILHKETVESENRVEEKLNKEYENMRREMEERLNKEINQIIQKVAIDVLGKSIDIELHRELVMKSLEEAKMNTYLNEINTKEVLDSFLVNLDRFLLDFAGQSSNNIDSILDKDYDYKFVDLVKSILFDAGLVDGKNKAKIEKLLREIRDELEKARVLRLTLAFTPDNKFISKIFSWVNEQAGGFTVIDLNYDPKIIGGAVIVYRGVYKDTSVLKKFNNYEFQSVSAKK